MENFSPEPYLNRFKKTTHRLGEGAFKFVYEAIDLDNGCSVAWNEVLTGHLDPSQKVQIEAEVELLRSVQHTNIIDIKASWASQDKVVFVTEIVESGDLQRFYRSHRIRLRVIKKWCRQVLSALSYLHSRQPPIVHRDVKCENILYNAGDGTVKIGDLGLSAFAVAEGGLTAIDTTTTLAIIGTPNYMAPEQYEGICDCTIDIYAFGMCVLEMVCSEIPYANCNAAQIYRRVSSGQLPETLWRIRSPNVQDFILYCVRPTEPGGKRPSAAQVLLHPFLSETVTTPEDDDVDLVRPRVRRPRNVINDETDDTQQDAHEKDFGDKGKGVTIDNGKVADILEDFNNDDEDMEGVDEDEEGEEEEEEEGEEESEEVENFWEHEAGENGSKHNVDVSGGTEGGAGDRSAVNKDAALDIAVDDDDGGFFYLGNGDDESLMDNSEDSSVNGGEVGWEAGPPHLVDIDAVNVPGNQLDAILPSIVDTTGAQFRTGILRSDSVSSSVGMLLHEDRPEITLNTLDPLSPASFFSPTDGQHEALETGRSNGNRNSSGFAQELRSNEHSIENVQGLNTSTDDITSQSLDIREPQITSASQFRDSQASPPTETEDLMNEKNVTSTDIQNQSSRSVTPNSANLDTPIIPSLHNIRNRFVQDQVLPSGVKTPLPAVVQESGNFFVPGNPRRTKVPLELVLEQDTIVDGQTIVNRASINFDFDRVQSDSSTIARELVLHLGSVQSLTVDEAVYVPFLAVLLETHRFECRVSSSAAFEGARLVLGPSAPRLDDDYV
jgi:serine/threonine protein kinase